MNRLQRLIKWLEIIGPQQMLARVLRTAHLLLSLLYPLNLSVEWQLGNQLCRTRPRVLSLSLCRPRLDMAWHVSDCGRPYRATHERRAHHGRGVRELGVQSPHFESLE